jgi:hypothetical protein
VQRDRAATLRPGHALPAFVLVPQIQGIFEEAIKADPECGIAYWERRAEPAQQPAQPAARPNLPLGLAAIQKAKAVGAKTERERDFIDALSVFYTDYDKVRMARECSSISRRWRGWRSAIPPTTKRSCSTPSRSMSGLASDKTYSINSRARRSWSRSSSASRHPGVAHYLIHLYDSPALAEKGIDAAKRYAEIAPAAPTRSTCPRTSSRASATGTDRSAPTSPRRAAKDSRISASNCTRSDYLVYAYLQLAGRESAQGHR